jgi:hypothetical protein
MQFRDYKHRAFRWPMFYWFAGLEARGERRQFGGHNIAPISLLRLLRLLEV